jgi:succinate-acetate transporter protein
MRSIPLIEQCSGNMVKKGNVVKAGGYIGIVTALVAYYCGLSEMLTADDIIQLPIGKLAPRRLD